MKKSKKITNYAIRGIIVLFLIPFLIIRSALNYLDENSYKWSLSISRKINSITHWLNDNLSVNGDDK